LSDAVNAGTETLIPVNPGDRTATIILRFESIETYAAAILRMLMPSAH